ncbi:cytochrome P450 [Nonomuraea sp. MG754425]|uniref:cytochrome P450 n=1 Tax=Nonomuraea sp. MG754425 TaxID=2570319 RepID=UPI001F2ED16F|nr:cytochrome P450 [Nonomuraea sp. MG754425]MCF6471371.1 cytochrome P450 [Nonomuraea sp. MG754425]
MPTITRPVRVTPAEALAVATTIALPALARGVVAPRPGMVRLAELTGAERHAIGLLGRLRAAYDGRPLLVPFGGRSVMVPLDPGDVRAVLTDRAFSPASRVKRGALAHFQPDGVLITREPDLRERRRELNERVLSADFAPYARVAEEEAATLPRTGVLTWPRFHAAHWRIVRRVVLGDGARDDVTLTGQLDRLLGDANWSGLRGQRTDVRGAFQRRLHRHLARAEPGSLAAVLARTPADAAVHAEGQVPHWLYSYDAGATVSFRALALLTSRPGPIDPGHLRAALLESARLWPTMPAILREVTGPTPYEVPQGTVVVIYAPYVNRAEAGDSYRPELWLDDEEGSGERWTGVPFSAGFAGCAGAKLMLSTSVTLLEALLRERSVTPSVTLEDPVPASLDHFRLRFAVKAADR